MIAPPRRPRDVALGLAAPLLAVVFSLLVALAGAARRRRPRLVDVHAAARLRPAAAQPDARAERRDHLLPVGARRRDRLPDEPVQHRRRRPVPPRRADRRLGRRRRAACRPGCTSSSSCWSRCSSAAMWAGLARPAQGDPRRQRGHLDDHAQRHRRPASWPSSCARSPSRWRAATTSAPRRSPSRAACGGLPLRASTPPLRPVFGFLPVAVARGHRLLAGARPHPLRLRAARHRPAPSRRRSRAASTSGAWSSRRCCCPAPSPGWSACRSCSATSYSYSLDFPAGLGFTGIAIALLGRNSPIGIAFGALLWAFLDVSSVDPRHRGRVPTEIVHDHAGLDRAVGRHRLRGSCAATGCAPSRRASGGSWPSAPTDGGGGVTAPTGSDRATTAASTVDTTLRRSRRAAVTRGRAAARRGGAAGPDVARARRHRRRRHHLRRHRLGARCAWPSRSAWPGSAALWSERAGVVNIGLEGMLILGTWFGGWAGYQYGPWAGVAAAVAFGAFGGLLHADRHRDVRRRPRRLRRRRSSCSAPASAQYLPSRTPTRAVAGRRRHAVAAGRATCRRSACPGVERPTAGRPRGHRAGSCSATPPACCAACSPTSRCSP